MCVIDDHRYQMIWLQKKWQTIVRWTVCNSCKLYIHLFSLLNIIFEFYILFEYAVCAHSKMRSLIQPAITSTLIIVELKWTVNFRGKYIFLFSRIINKRKKSSIVQPELRSSKLKHTFNWSWLLIQLIVNHYSVNWFTIAAIVNGLFQTKVFYA